MTKQNSGHPAQTVHTAQDKTMDRRTLLGTLGAAAVTLSLGSTLWGGSGTAAAKDKDKDQVESGLQLPFRTVTLDGAEGGAELLAILGELPAGGTIYIPSGLQLLCPAVITIAAPVTLVGYGASITAGHTGKHILEIASDDVRVIGLSLVGNAAAPNENAVFVGMMKKRIRVSQIKTSNTLVGFSTDLRVSRVVLEKSSIDCKVHGAVFRFVTDCVISECTIRGEDVKKAGGTGIRLQGLTRTGVTVAPGAGGNTVTATGHGLVEGDKVRFYGEGTVTLPAGMELDTTYYVAANPGADQFSIAAAPGEAPIALGGAASTGNVKALAVSKNMTVTDCVITNSRAGIYFLQTDDSLIENNRIDNGTCIQIENSWYNRISKNHVLNAYDLGINLHQNSSYNAVSDNQAHYCQNANIGLTIDVKFNIANNNYNVVTGNVCSGAKVLPGNFAGMTGSGIELNGAGRHNVITNNEIRNNFRYGIVTRAGMIHTLLGSNQVTGNMIGISVGNDSISLQGNHVFGNKGDGIVASKPTISFMVIEGNTVRDNAGAGIKLGTDTQLSIVTGNLLNGNAAGQNLVPSGKRNNRIYHNLSAEDGNQGTVRPTEQLFPGLMWFDTILQKPVWYKGDGVWVDGTGAAV